MSANSRRDRQERAVLARYLGPLIVEQMLGVDPDQLGAWAAGDARVSHNNSVRVGYVCFEHAARTFGLDDAHVWFETENLGLDGSTPVEAIADQRDVRQVLDAARADAPHNRTPLPALDCYGTPRVAPAGDWRLVRGLIVF